MPPPATSTAMSCHPWLEVDKTLIGALVIEISVTSL